MLDVQKLNKSSFSKMRGYNLSRTFRLKETQISMRLVFPFAIIHSTIYACFMALAVFSTYWVMGLDPHRAIPVLQLLGVVCFYSF